MLGADPEILKREERNPKNYPEILKGGRKWNYFYNKSKNLILGVFNE